MDSENWAPGQLTRKSTVARPSAMNWVHIRDRRKRAPHCHAVAFDIASNDSEICNPAENLGHISSRPFFNWMSLNRSLAASVKGGYLLGMGVVGCVRWGGGGAVRRGRLRNPRLPDHPGTCSLSLCSSTGPRTEYDKDRRSL